MAGIYIHIPFCKQACHYCDFHFSTNQHATSEMVAAISKEIAMQKTYLEGDRVKTIYFGGGTPSLLTQREVELLLNRIHECYSVSDSPEITLEANPDDLNPLKLKEFSAAGINRLSIGIQSFHDDLLRFLNRTHDAASALKSFANARDAGFKNISIDLIYAIPGESHKQWESDIDHAVALYPDHISCYSLTIEQQTAFGKWAASGKIKPEADEVSASHFELLMTRLHHAGYEHYEISNFAKPGFHSRHNSSYWQQNKYVGIGPSAHSYNGESRQYNISNNSLYLKSMAQDKIPFEMEVLTQKDKINEYILTRLRTAGGIDLKKIKQNFEHDLMKENGSYILQLLKKEFAIVTEDNLLLTQKGKLLADKISSDLFAL